MHLVNSLLKPNGFCLVFSWFICLFFGGGFICRLDFVVFCNFSLCFCAVGTTASEGAQSKTANCKRPHLNILYAFFTSDIINVLTSKSE